MSALDIITVAELKTHLGAISSATDSELSFFVTSASTKIDELAGPVIQRTFTQVDDGSLGRWKSKLSLRQLPVVSITSLTETGVVLDPSLYQINKLTGILTRAPLAGYYGTPFPPGTQNIVTVYVAGRTAFLAGTTGLAGDVPTLRMACLELAAHWWRNTKLNKGRSNVPGTVGNDADGYAMAGIGFAVPNRVTEMIGNKSRIPGVA